MSLLENYARVVGPDVIAQLHQLSPGRFILGHEPDGFTQACHGCVEILDGEVKISCKSLCSCILGILFSEEADNSVGLGLKCLIFWISDKTGHQKLSKFLL